MDMMTTLCFLLEHITVGTSVTFLFYPYLHFTGAAVTGTGIIGFFNVSQRPLSELIPLSKFPGVIEAQFYIVRAHSSGLISRPMQVVDRNALLYISLGVRGYDILSAYPLRGFVDEKKSETTWIANLGLLGKMSGAAAVVDNKITKLEGGRIFIDTNIKALGVLGKFTLHSLLTGNPTKFYRHLHIRPSQTVIPREPAHHDPRRGLACAHG
jgi:hypothetical protein